ncbi:MFS transporter [Hydrogenimonas urashimensis]|uniref:MFS transporter n=1 Tax=Hydrogenimonas urashimensis TaxID=2740515 RepID=UPI0019153B68|nr:MFS transporter [Hydrogenimonas urashimensis]
MDKFSNHIKNILHGFFLSVGTTIAEPATILPLMINYFGGSSVLIGFFSGLLRGGAVLMQLFAAYKAQHYARMLPYLRRVFAFRFLSWFMIGVAILLFGKSHPTLTLWCIGIGLFLFSFSAGFGAIYFREIVAKIFSHRFRGKTMAWRQFFSGLGALISGAVAAWVLERFEAPYDFGYLFILSALLMGIGLLAFATVDEPVKTRFETKIESFTGFLRHAFSLVKVDRQLQVQIVTFLLAYGYLIAMPFVILDAKETIHLGGKEVGILITVQMVGAMISNVLWGRLGSLGRYRFIATFSIFLKLVAVGLAFFADTLIAYGIIFFLFGAAGDGSRIASSNLILILAPEAKRPLYVAVQMNIVSLGMFFSILGGFLLHFGGYTLLYGVTALTLLIAFTTSFRLKDQTD